MSWRTTTSARGEHRVGRGLVSGLPVEAVVVGLAGEVVADHRRGRVERGADVHDGGQRLVLDVDELERVPGRVPVLGDDEGHLLALEADLVGGQHRLHVVGQRRHPGQAALGEHRAGDDQLHLRVRLGGADVHAHDPPVGDRRAEDRQVQHAGQLDVVDEAALAADEPRVLLAQHPAVAHRLAVVVDELGGHGWSSTVTTSGCRPPRRRPTGPTGRSRRSRCSGRSDRRWPPGSPAPTGPGCGRAGPGRSSASPGCRTRTAARGTP